MLWAQRVSNHDEELSKLTDLVSNLARSVNDLGKDLRGAIERQSADFAKSRTPNWPALLTTGVAIAGTIGGFGWALIAPTVRDLSNLTEIVERMEDKYTTVEFAKDNFALIRSRIAKTEADI